MMRQTISCSMVVTNAHSAVPIAYSTMVMSNTRLRPYRSAIGPKSTPPTAQPTRKMAVMTPVQ